MIPVHFLRYTIWAADAERATQFYETCFGAEVARRNPHITELACAGGRIAIHGGGEGQPTWTGLTFECADVVAGVGEVLAAGGTCERPPEPEGDEPPHLAICRDTEGNSFMLSRRRS